MIRGKFLFFLFFISLFSVAYSYDYRLPVDNEYYLNINLDKNIGGNTYEKVQKQINSQYKGNIKKRTTVADFNLYEYGYYMNLGFTGNLTKNEKIKSNIKGSFDTDYETKILGVVGLGLFWYNGLRLEVEYSQDNKKEKQDGFKVELSKYIFNTILEHYMYNVKLTPYAGFGAGVIKAETEAKKDYKPLIQGIVGASYNLDKNTSLYLQYKLATTITDLDTGNYKFGYLNNSLDFGIRIFLF